MTKEQGGLLVAMIRAFDEAQMAAEGARNYKGSCFIEAIHAIARRASDKKADATLAFLESLEPTS